ncbi:MAG: histidine kinase dimerization/phospho-acceptor domain-containing protein, partial [Mariprofundaceae bacterium]|nr:histidine kinase dimerization/phospho-acceptor domain-containing protein [Mariprofundaceae bacterium]
MHRQDELGSLAASFNRLVDHLQQRVRQQRIISEAVIGLSREMAGEAILKHVGELAVQITGARYCMLAYLKDGEKHFIPLGLDSDVLEQLKNHPPQGLGLLGLLWGERRVVRTADIASHPEAIGFPEGHPPMRTFLGAPIEFAGEMIGAMYLCDREDGQPFSEHDETMLRMLASSCAVALSNAQQFERLKQANEDLEARVAERTRALADANRLLSNREIELELMNDELRQANEAKNQFLANTSHELRTPLNAIIGFSDLLLTAQSQSMPSRQKEYVEHINSAGRQLLELINSLLDLSKIEAGMLEINEEPGSAGVVLDYTVSQLKPLADKKGLTLCVNKPEKEAAIYLDTGKLQQVWVNLIGNAIKFTPEGGNIEAGFSILGEDGESVLSGYVQDSGIGLAPEDVDR